MEPYITPIINHFEKIIPLNAEEKAYVTEAFQPRLYRKKQYILQEGDVCHVLNFVVSGCLRMYTINEKGTQYIVHFAAENEWISNLMSLYKETPSEFSIDALENTTVLQIKREDLFQLYGYSPKFNRIFRVLIEEAYAQLQQRFLLSISASAQEKYRYFTQAYPTLLQFLHRLTSIGLQLFPLLERKIVSLGEVYLLIRYRQRSRLIGYKCIHLT